MSEHQTLLDKAVTLLNAERGFIVLYDSTTCQFGEYVASHNFERLPWDWSSDTTEEPFREINNVWDVMKDIVAQGQAVLTDNTSASHYYFRLTDLIGWSLRCVLAIPLVRDGNIYGLLWCDQRIKQGIWDKQDLAQLVDLVNQFLR